MNGGGVQGLLDENGEKASQLSPEEKQVIEDEFAEIYKNDPQLKNVLGGDPSQLTTVEKFQILEAYKKGGGV